MFSVRRWRGSVWFTAGLLACWRVQDSGNSGQEHTRRDSVPFHAFGNSDLHSFLWILGQKLEIILPSLKPAYWSLGGSPSYIAVLWRRRSCVFLPGCLSLLGLLRYDSHSHPGNVCPPPRWHIWRSSCCSLTLCWWKCSPSPPCKSGSLSFISSPMPLRKSGRWVTPSTFVFTSARRCLGLIMKTGRWVKSRGETGNANPNLLATGRVFRGTSWSSALTPCHILGWLLFLESSYF